MVLDENRRLYGNGLLTYEQIRREEESEEEPKEEQTLKKNVWYSQNTENKIKRKKMEFFFRKPNKRHSISIEDYIIQIIDF